MGAVDIYVQGQGMTMQDAIIELKKRAINEYGTDYYNGKINNTTLCKDLTNLYELCTTKAQKERFIREWTEKAFKGEVYGVCIVQPKQRMGSIKVKRNVQRGARKWITVYEIEDHYGEIVATKNNQADAIKTAKELTERKNSKHYIFINKIFKGDSPMVATIEPKKANCSMGKYIFFGSAPN